MVQDLRARIGLNEVALGVQLPEPILALALRQGVMQLTPVERLREQVLPAWSSSSTRERLFAALGGARSAP